MQTPSKVSASNMTLKPSVIPCQTPQVSLASATRAVSWTSDRKLKIPTRLRSGSSRPRTKAGRTSANGDCSRRPAVALVATVGGGVNLKGGVFASTAEKEKNSLIADHLTYSYVENTSKASASRVGMNLGPTGIPVRVVGDNPWRRKIRAWRVQR